MRNSGSFFSARDKPVQISELVCTAQGNLRGMVVLEQIVEEPIPSSKNFSLVDLNKKGGTYGA